LASNRPVWDFKKFYPSDPLKPYIRYYFVFSSESHIQFEDTVFPSGDMEIIFNLGDGIWETAVDNKFLKNPQDRILGQITQPVQIRSTGKHTMLGIKFFYGMRPDIFWVMRSACSITRSLTPAT